MPRIPLRPRRMQTHGAAMTRKYGHAGDEMIRCGGTPT